MRETYKPNSTDWKIIALLNEDGRMPSTEIARRLGNITSRTVNTRIQILTQHNIIIVRAILNPQVIGYGVLADVYLDVDPGRAREVAEVVAKFPQASYVACATGESDVSISLRAHSIEELFNFIEEKLGKIPGVRDTKSHILPLKIKDLDTWLPSEALEANNGNDTK